MSSDDPLRSAELGNRTLWVINGPEAILACVISGTPPRALRDELMVLLESMHARYGERFDETDDALANDIGMRVLMQQSLREELDNQKITRKRSKAPIYWAIAVILLLALLGWKSWQANQQRQTEARIVKLIKNQPGYIVSSSYRENGELVIEGLRDPATATPESILVEQDLPAQDLEFRLKPFLSLEPVVVLKGLRTSLGLTDSTGLTLKDGTLAVNGVIGNEQTEKLIGLTGAHPLIDTVDLSGTKLKAEDALQLARLQLDVPGTVELKSVDGQIMISGLSDIPWYLERSQTPLVFGGWQVSFEPLLKELQARQRTDIGQLDGATFFFSRVDRPSVSSEAELDAYAQDLSDVMQSSGQLGINLRITLVGKVDGTGTAEQNERTSHKRVEVVRDRLIEAGIVPQQIQSEYLEWHSGSENLSQRCVTVRIVDDKQP